MSALIVGDLHLGKGLSIGKPGVGTTLNSRIVDQIRLLDWVVEQAITEHVSSIILTGDICEAVKPDYILLELFVDFLKQCESYGITVHIIAGNHDLKRTGTRYASYLDLVSAFDMPHVHVYKNISTIIEDGVAFTFLPFRDMRSLDCTENDEALDKISSWITYELAGIPASYTKVLVGHLAIEGSIYIGDEFDNISNELMCPASMFEGYDYTVMGHVHKPQELEEEPYVAHVGSLDISDFGETDHEKIIMVFDNSEDYKIKEITVPSRPLRHIPVNVPAGFDATTYVLKKIRAVNKAKSFDRAIVKIEIKLLDEDSDGSDRQEIIKEAYALGAFHVILTESKSVSAVLVTNQTVVNNEIGPEAAIEVYAEGEEFYSDKEKEDFTGVCKDIVTEWQSKV
jgi:exonuclease SbcD